MAFLMRRRTQKRAINYLDDFLFTALLKIWCNWQVKKFLELCEEVNFPVSAEKTVWGCTSMVFLGLLLDTINQLVCIPKDKLDHARHLIKYFLSKKKVMVRQVQKLTGFLNFLCRAIIPGRAFTRCMYGLVSSSMLPHHHLRVTEEFKQDLVMWDKFLSTPQAYSRPFMDFGPLTAIEIDMFSDASKSLTTGGMGAYSQEAWMFTPWNYEFLKQAEPSIAYLELYAVTAAVITWIHRFKNKNIYLFCDNMSAVHMINNSSSKCKNCMVLIRLITLYGITNNVHVFARHVDTKSNYLADCLSQLKIDQFRLAAPHYMKKCPTPVPNEIWLMEKIWKF